MAYYFSTSDTFVLFVTIKNVPQSSSIAERVVSIAVTQIKIGIY